MKKLIQSIELDKLFNKDDTLVIGVSTGIDSMSLFHYLQKLGYKLVVAHINHKRRAESDKECEFLKNYTKELCVPFETSSIEKELNGNFQQEARKFRYDFYKSVADKYHTNIILTAHNLDDEAETILMRLIRGTSLRGYHGMNVLSMDESYKIIRPLLHTSRKEIEIYSAENNVPYFEDSSNAENHYTRNIIRHFILSKIKEINPDFLNAIIRFSDDQKDAFNLVESLTQAFFNEHVTIKEKCISFSVDAFLKEANIVMKNIVLKSINLLTSNTVLATHERIDEIIKAASSTGSLVEIKENYICVKEYDQLVFTVKEEIVDIFFQINDFGKYQINEEMSVIISHNYHLLPNKNSYMLCYNDVRDVFPINVRNIKDGDAITVMGCTKKVNDVLNEHKIPKRLRHKVLLVENKNGIFFINEVLRKETGNASNVLYITFEGGSNENNGRWY